ncbi:hypothetical protein POVCU1_038430, partial [Plasmodium ovale curtisi]
MKDVHRLERDGNSIMSSDKRCKLATTRESKCTERCTPLAHIVLIPGKHSPTCFPKILKMSRGKNCAEKK